MGTQRMAKNNAVLQKTNFELYFHHVLFLVPQKRFLVAACKEIDTLRCCIFY